MSELLTPILAPNSTWFNNSYNIKRNFITEINVVDTFVPVGEEGVDYYSWDGSAERNGSIIVYAVKTDIDRKYRLYLAGNGYGKIYANEDSSYVFSCASLAATEGFVYATNINGLALLDTRNATTMRRFFCECNSLKSLDLRSFDTANVDDMDSMFYGCEALLSLNLSTFDTSNVTNMYDAFGRCYSLEKITLGEKFSFNGNGIVDDTKIAVLPTPSIFGYWWDRNRTAYAPEDVPSNTAATYYSNLDLVNNIQYRITNGRVLDIADEIRELSGTAEAMGIADMKNNLTEANAEVDSQAELIAQIASALEGKAGGGGSAGGSGSLKSAYIAASYTGRKIYFSEGMTWLEWCNSEHNSIYSLVDGSPVLSCVLEVRADGELWESGDTGFGVCKNGISEPAHSSDKIIENFIYILEYLD